MPFHAELILKGGTVVNHDGVGPRDIAVSGGRIVGLGSFGREMAGEDLALIPLDTDRSIEFRLIHPENRAPSVLAETFAGFLRAEAGGTQPT